MLQVLCLLPNTGVMICMYLSLQMVGNKFLQDDGEDEEVICSEWAVAGNVDLADLKRLEIEFLNAIVSTNWL